MAGTINNFLQNIKTDIARPSRFDVYIPIPQALALVYGQTSLDLSYKCEIAQLPGRHISTIERKTYGPYEKLPYHTTYNDIDLTFIVSDVMKQKYFFDAWLDLINPVNTFDIEYKDNYCVDIIINQYDLASKLTYAVGLVDAYPINMNQLDLDWSNSDGLHKLSVTFAYTYWINDKQVPSNPPSPGDSSSKSIGPGAEAQTGSTTPQIFSGG